MDVCLFYDTKEGQSAVTDLATMATIDKYRPFRISHIGGMIASYGQKPVSCQVEVMAQPTPNLNPWVSPPFLATPNGHRLRFTIPRTTVGWWAPVVDDKTILMKLKAICVDKTPASGVTGFLTIRIEFGPRDYDQSCPKFLVNVDEPSSSGTPDSWSLGDAAS